MLARGAEMEHLMEAEGALSVGRAGRRRLGVAAGAFAVLGALALLSRSSLAPANAGPESTVGLAAAPKITTDMLKKDLAGLQHVTTKNEESSHPPESDEAVAAVLKVCEDAKGDGQKICEEFGSGSCGACAKEVSAAWSKAKTEADKAKLGKGLLRGEFKCDGLAAGADAGERKLDDDLAANVLEIGDGLTKAGYAGDDVPRAIFPTLVGRPRHQGVMVGMGGKHIYVGDEAQAKRGILNLERPVQQGKVVDWEDWEKLVHHSFYNELRVAPEEHDALLIHPPDASDDDRAHMAKVLFETFNVPKLALASSASLSLYAAGRITGLAVVSGAECTWITPVIYGKEHRQPVQRLDIGTVGLTEHLIKLLSDRYSLTTTAEREVANDIRQKMVYVATDFEKEVHTSKTSSRLQKSYEFPDGQVISLDSEQFATAEAFFQPTLMGLDQDSLPKQIVKALEACDEADRAELSQNIVLSGENTLYPGLGERLTKELQRLGMKDAKVIAEPARKNAAWIGGSIFASLAGFSQDYATSKEDFKAKGAQALAWH